MTIAKRLILLLAVPLLALLGLGIFTRLLLATKKLVQAYAFVEAQAQVEEALKTLSP